MIVPYKYNDNTYNSIKGSINLRNKHKAMVNKYNLWNKARRSKSAKINGTYTNDEICSIVCRSNTDIFLTYYIIKKYKIKNLFKSWI